MLRSNHQREGLLKWTERWIETKPNYNDAYGKYLEALVKLDRVEDANETAKRWLHESMRVERLPAWELVRINAAINFAMGQVRSGYRHWMEPEFYAPLLEAAQFFLTHEYHYGISNSILARSEYVNTKEVKQGKQIAADILKTGAAELEPYRLSSLVDLLLYFEELEKEDWLTIAKTLRKRWQEESDARNTPVIGQSLEQIYATHASASEHIAFLQIRLKRAIARRVEKHRLQNLENYLLTTILRQPWSDEIESAAFEMLSQISYLEDPGKILAAKVDRLQLITDTMKTGLVAAAEEKFRSNEHPEKLTRPELAEKQKAMRQQALARIAERLAAEHENLRRMRVDGLYPDMHEEFTKWVKLELLHYRVLAADRTADNLYEKDGDFGSVIQACRKMLGEEPASATPEGDKTENEGDDDNEYLILSKQSRQQRAWTILSNLAVRKSAPDSLPSDCLLYTSPSPRDQRGSRMPSSA